MPIYLIWWYVSSLIDRFVYTGGSVTDGSHLDPGERPLLRQQTGDNSGNNGRQPSYVVRCGARAKAHPLARLAHNVWMGANVSE